MSYKYLKSGWVEWVEYYMVTPQNVGPLLPFSKLYIPTYNL